MGWAPYERKEMKTQFKYLGELLQLFLLTGEEVSPARAGGQNEGDSEHGGGEIQTFSAPC